MVFVNLFIVCNVNTIRMQINHFAFACILMQLFVSSC